MSGLNRNRRKMETKKQSKREVQKYTLQERVDSLRSQLNFKQVNKRSGKKKESAKKSRKLGFRTIQKCSKRISQKMIESIWIQWW